MNDIATHLRVTGLQYDNSDVDARRGAVATLKTAWAKQTQVPLILGKAEQIIDALTTGVPAEALGLEIQAAVQKKASAFLYEDRPLEVGIVAAVAAQQVVSGDGKGLDGWMIAEVEVGEIIALHVAPPLTTSRFRVMQFEPQGPHRSFGGAFSLACSLSETVLMFLVSFHWPVIINALQQFPEAPEPRRSFTACH